MTIVRCLPSDLPKVPFDSMNFVPVAPDSALPSDGGSKIISFLLLVTNQDSASLGVVIVAYAAPSLQGWCQSKSH